MNKKLNKLIPDLRFPEFANELEWQEKTLNNLGNLINGLTYSPDDIREKGLLVLRSSNVQNGQIVLNDCVYVKPEIKGANLIQSDDILICIRNGSKGLIGKNAIIPKQIKLATHGAFMTVFRAEYPKFVFQLFQTDAYSNQVNADLGATINSINGGNFLRYKFIVPKPNEQKKIASCLSSLDELIAANNQKLDALKEYKKGLVQNLFPQEGETVPKLRFKEFLKNGDWVVKTLGSLVNIKSGYSPSTYNLNNTGKYPFVKVEDLNNCAKYQIKSREYSDDAENLIPKESVLFPKRGAAIQLNKVRINPKEILMDTNLMAITPNDEIEVEFLYYTIHKVGLYKIADTSTIPQINNKHIEPYEIILPSKKEQKKIAFCLSTLDELIMTQIEKIEQLNLHKKGLMQGLFPKVNN